MTGPFHAITCTEERCDPPRSIAYVASRGRDGTARRIAVVRLPGCPIGNPDDGPTVRELLVAHLEANLDRYEQACRAQRAVTRG